MLDELKKEIAPYKQRVINHPIYQSLRSLEDIRSFMGFHVYAVWDFMSLLKELQRRFTNVHRIWYPRANPRLARLINQIVVAEESDETEDGTVISHYEWYVAAMKQAGAWTEEFSTFYEYSKISSKLDVPMLAPNPYVEKFLAQTFHVIDFGNDHQLAAYFLIGREALIPEMFLKVTEELEAQNFPVQLFTSYLKRHIEVDGNEHGPLVDRILSELCGNDLNKWQEAKQSAQQALESRNILWDGAFLAVNTSQDKKKKEPC